MSSLDQIRTETTSQIPDWILRVVMWLPNLLFIYLFGLLFNRALGTIDFNWDAVAYHIPFAARHVGLYSAENFIFTDSLERLFYGSPPLAYYLQGILWRLTGEIAATNLVGWGALLTFVGFTAVRFRFPFWQVGLLAFSVPLFLLHSNISYVDLITNVFILIGLANLAYAFYYDQHTLRNYIFVLLPFALAANTKWQAVQVLVFIIPMAVFWFVYRLRNDVFHNWRPNRLFYLYAGVTLIMAVLTTFSWVENWIQQGNPIYPFGLSVGPLQFDNGSGWSDVTDTTESGQFSLFIRSLLEINIWEDNIGTLWTATGLHDSNTNNPSFKLGGYFVLNLVLWGATLIILPFRYMDKRLMVLGGFLIVLFVLVGLFTKDPQFLRYFMFLPMFMIVLVLLTIKVFQEREKTFIAFFLAIQIASFTFVNYQLQHLYSPVSREGNVANYVSVVEPNEAVCVSGADWRFAVIVKYANPDSIVEASRDQVNCVYPSWENE